MGYVKINDKKSNTMNKKKLNSPFSKQNRWGWAFVSIALILITIFMLYPIVKSIILTFQTVKGSNATFVGLSNYARLLKDPNFWTSVKNTVVYLIIQVPVMLILALVLASLLNSKDLKFRGFYRTAIFLPCVTSLVGYSVLFKMMFSSDGIINKFLLGVNMISEPITWLGDPTLARVVIVLALLWRWTGYNMIFYLSSLQNIPQETYEAAKVDGANSIQTFFKITIPQLKPIILFTTIMSTIGTLQLFDEAMNITKGGPGNSTMTISQYIYNTSFVYKPDFAYSATISYAIVIMVVVLSIIQFKVARDKDEN